MMSFHPKSKLSIHQNAVYYDQQLLCSVYTICEIFCGSSEREGSRNVGTRDVVVDGIDDQKPWVCFAVIWRVNPDEYGYFLEFFHGGHTFSGRLHSSTSTGFAVRAVVENINKESTIWVACGDFRRGKLFSSNGTLLENVQELNTKFNFFPKEEAVATISFAEKEQTTVNNAALTHKSPLSLPTQFARVAQGFFHPQQTLPVGVPRKNKRMNLLNLRSGEMYFSVHVDEIHKFGTDFVVRQRGMYNLFSPSFGLRSPIWFTDVIAVGANSIPLGEHHIESAKEIWFIVGNKFVTMKKNRKFSLNNGGVTANVERV